MAKSTQSKEYHNRIRREKRRHVLRTIFELIVVVVLAALTAFVVFSSVILQESAMSPTLEAGNQVLVNRAAYILTGVRRGDVIAYRSSGTFDSGVHVKRVIGLPGETIQIRDGLILINGKTYIESREFPNITNPGVAENSVHLGSDEYFVLGDNRNNSEDSRFADVGNIRKTNIIGRVWFRIRPYTSVGFVH
ncbi:MAG: signal peptidase I [Lachnospiraceae bacterium]|nr:signal peptidase I [Lachnospiraceae bacterium]